MIKLQHLAVIFAIIIIPLSLILGYYVRSEIDTLKLQASYDESLISATYDAIKAYQINTSKNEYSDIKTSEKRDVEAAKETFMNSFATGLGVGGYGENAIKPYVPAILFTLNSSYYIYAPTYNANSGKYEHILKPYFTYTARYVKGNTDVFISYSLDNFITVTGYVNGTYENRSGYLIDNYSVTKGEMLSETLPIYNKNTGQIQNAEYKYAYIDKEKRYFDDSNNRWFYYKKGTKYYLDNTGEAYNGDTRANAFVTENKSFTTWVTSALGNLTVKDIQLTNDVISRNRHLRYLNDSNAKIFVANKFDDPDSVFNVHKSDIIRMSIKENLSSAITGYNAHAGTTGVFKMPNLKESEWEQVTTNICAIAFVQGLPVGFKTFNSYAIVNNTESKNYIDRYDMAFITSDSSEYHTIDCPYLDANSSNLIGYKISEFESTTVEIIKASSEDRGKVTYYKHSNLPCYYCIVSKNYTKQAITGTRLNALHQALAREKQLLH